MNNKKYPFYFWAVPQLALESKELELEEAVLIGILATRINGDNRAWPKQSYLADKMGRDERTIRRLRLRLEEKGWLQVCRNSPYSINHYSIPKIGFDCDCPSSGRSRPSDSLSGGHLCPIQSDIDVLSLKKEEENREEKTKNDSSADLSFVSYSSPTTRTDKGRSSLAGQERAKLGAELEDLKRWFINCVEDKFLGNVVVPKLDQGRLWSRLKLRRKLFSLDEIKEIIECDLDYSQKSRSIDPSRFDVFWSLSDIGVARWQQREQKFKQMYG